MIFDIEVKISLKRGMLNPEATTIERSLDLLGYKVKNAKTVDIIKFQMESEAEDNALETTDIVKLFQRIRDESHRFAVSYHTVLKRQQQTKNQLEEIPGVGPKTRRKLIRKFGSVTGVSRASIQELSMAIGEQKAKTVAAFLRDVLKT